MGDNTWEELAGENTSIDIIINHGQSVMHIDREKRTCTISTKDMVLEYDMKELKKLPVGYIEAQIAAHKSYTELVRKELFTYYRENADEQKNENEVGGIFEFIPVKMHWIYALIGRLIALPYCLVKGATVSSVIEERSKSTRTSEIGYLNLMNAFNGWGSILEKRIQEASDNSLREQLEQWRGEVQEISYLYKRLAGAAANRKSAIDRWRGILYPAH